MGGVETALRLIAALRRDEPLRREVEALGVDATLADLVRVGAHHGYEFTGDELKAAIRYDWTMRWHRYAPVERPT